MARFFAYAHCRPDGTPFYIGKGTWRRAHTLTPTLRSEWHRHIVAKHDRTNIIVEAMPCRSEAEAFLREQLAISALRAAGVELVNQKDGGEGGTNPSAEVRAKMSEAKRGKPSNRRGIPHTAEARAKLRAANLGKKQSAETIAKRAATHRGMKHLGAGPKISAALLGRKHSAEHIAKTAAAKRGRPLSSEHRAKLAESGRQAWANHPNLLRRRRSSQISS